MKNVTRIIALVLVLCMAFAGCGKDKANEGKVTVGDYTGFTITKYDTTVTQEEINNAISTFLSENKYETPVTDLGAARGNKVVIDFKGYVDGVAFDGGTAENYTLNSLGYGSFIDGFEESIIGKKTGESFSAELQFPDPYPNSPDLAGKPVTFEITVKSVAIVEVPEYTEENVRLYAGYDTITEFEAYLAENLRVQKEQAGILAQENELWAQLLAVSEVTEWPQDKIDAHMAQMKSYFEAYAQMFQMTYTDFLAYAGFGTEAEANEYMLEDAKAVVKQSLVTSYMVEKNNLSYTEAEYNDFITGYAAENGMTADDVISNYPEEEIANAVYYYKIVDLLRQTAVEVEPTTAE